MTNAKKFKKEEQMIKGFNSSCKPGDKVFVQTDFGGPVETTLKHPAQR